MSESRYKEALANQLLSVSVAIGDANRIAELETQLGSSEREVRKARAQEFVDALVRASEPED